MDYHNLCYGCFAGKRNQDPCLQCGLHEETEPESLLHLPPGTFLQGKYLIGRALGQGGFGITYLAFDTSLNLKLAIKEYLPRQLATRTGGEQTVTVFKKSLAEEFNYGMTKFLEEARTLTRFNEHPNIVTVRDYFKANGTAYQVMNHIEGVTLKEYLAGRDNPLTFKNALDIFMPVLDVLKEVHATGMLHRDISLDNLLLDPKGRVVLIDFGYARLAMGDKSRSIPVIIGSYSPRELSQSKGKQGPWTDIYAVAATMYYAVTVKPSLKKIDHGGKLNTGQEQVLLRALRLRFQTVKEFQTALKMAIAMKEFTICINDHYYDNEKHRVCPFCVVETKEDSKKTVPNVAPPFGGNNKLLDQRLVDANNGLGINIFLKLAEAGEGQNLFISPASIIISLAIAYNGSTGDTRLAMEKTLQFEGMGMEEVNAALAGLLINLKNPDPEVELIVANSLWGREGVSFNEDFLQCNRDHFKAKIAALDFSSAEAASIINKWVCENTQNRIEGIVEPQFSDKLMLLLINAIYFKGSWAVPFLKTMTEDKTFNLTGGSIKKHPTMFSYGDFRYLKNHALFQAVNLPYGENERVSMYVFLPSPNTGIEGFCSKLNVANWKKWTGSFRKINGMLGLPRFKFEYKTSLKNALTALGMGMAFDEDRADYSGISSPPPQLYIGDVKHKTFIEVNEEGTVAAAATAIDLIAGESMEMMVDRPFFFSIVDNMTGVILFMGMVLEPKT